MSDRLGCYWYLGKTQSGKSKKAFADLLEDIRTTGWRSLIIDPMPAWNFAHLPHEKSLEGVLQKLFEEKTHAVWTPGDDEEELDRLMSALREVGRVHVLWDETNFHMSKQSITKPRSKALRGWAHSKLTFRMVTQRPGDIHGDAYACDPEVYCFRIDKVGDLERVHDEFGFDPEAVKALAVEQFLTKKRGF